MTTTTTSTTTTSSRDGHELLLVDTVETALYVIDTWRDLSQPGVGVALLVRPGVAPATVEPFVPWASLLGVAWDTEPQDDPCDRLGEALRQGRAGVPVQRRVAERTE